MVTQAQLLNDKRYKFKYINLYALENEGENVLAFVAAFNDATLPGEAMSKGKMEINKTLWDSGSSRRPPGYFLLKSVTKDGVGYCFFVTESWMKQHKHDEKDMVAAWEGLGWAE